MVNVIATIRAKSGKEKETEHLLRGLLQPTHREKGCVKYTLHRRKEAPGTFYFIEAWDTEQDLKNHLASSHIGAVKAREAELLEFIDIAQVEIIRDGSSEKGNLWDF
jgi:quinol monooxygenase YgiN